MRARLGAPGFGRAAAGGRARDGSSRAPNTPTHHAGLPLPSLQNAQLKDLKTELAALRVAKVTGGAPNKLSKM